MIAHDPPKGAYPSPEADGRRLAVLLASYNGGPHLRPQLDSIAAQTRKPDLLLVSDDGSTDGSRDVVSAFSATHPHLDTRLLDGPRAGAAMNFLSLIARVPGDIDTVSLSDQDDVWLPHKLRNALDHLKEAEALKPDRPLLYCSRTFVCDENLGARRASRYPTRQFGFRNALTQNVAAGNTIVLNREALALARMAATVTRDTVVHDWWLYQIVTGAGGQVVFDPEPLLLYRQHGANLIGANSGLLARLRRMRHLWTGVYRDWTETNLSALEAIRPQLTSENAALLSAFAAGRRRPSATGRLAAIRDLGLYRQGRLGQISLYAAALMGKV